QAGAIVTCQAMTARPFGAGPSAANAAVAQAKIPSDSRTAAMQRRSPSDLIRLLPIGRCFFAKEGIGSGIVGRFTGSRQPAWRDQNTPANIRTASAIRIFFTASSAV